jgi:glutamine amidotransferase-like uncharacterized protein
LWPTANKVRSDRNAPSLLEAACRILMGASPGFILLLTACSPADGPSPAKDSPTILLFDGSGTSPNDVSALEGILSANHLSYVDANSRQLNAMSRAQLLAYRLLIVPGGNFEEIGNGLTRSTTATIRDAVQGGLSYLGMCAGAFFAGNSPYNGLNLTGRVRFNFYALEGRNIRKAVVTIAVAGSSTFDQYWEDGPQLTGWGEIVAKYSDGTPAIVEGTEGDGWVILSGIHPEAPESWRRGMSFATSARVDNAYAATLIGAALSRTRLAHY